MFYKTYNLLDKKQVTIQVKIEQIKNSLCKQNFLFNFKTKGKFNSLEVDISRCFVDHDNFTFAQNGP